MKEFFAQNEVGKKAAEAKEADGGAPPRDVRKLGMTMSSSGVRGVSVASASCWICTGAAAKRAGR